MPTYEYRCKGCDRHLEVVQAFTDDALTTCDACGGDLRKVFGNVGISFKGSGFYKNDSRGSSSATAGSSAADKGSTDKGSSDTAGNSSDKGSSDKASSDKTSSSGASSSDKGSSTPSTPASTTS